MYKDADRQREAVRLAVQKSRAKGITSEGITITLDVIPDGMIRDEQGYYYKELKGGLKGQRWYPGRNGYHPEGCVCGIEHRKSPHIEGLD